MRWQIGQKVVCDRPEQLLTGCYVVTTDAETVKISCPAAGIVVSGDQRRLEEMGWRSEELCVCKQSNEGVLRPS